MHDSDASTAFNWNEILTQLSYANGKPEVRGVLKSTPEDFKVTELMDVVPSGEGEHYWLDISKVKCNTEQVAKALARFANVSPRDVGYSGMKDFFAQTRQWFSVWKPKGGEPAWHEFKLDGVTVHQAIKHSRKIKRGTHYANQFTIVIRDLEGDVSQLESRFAKVVEQGVPNYFGPQRFGRNADNMQQALDLFSGVKKVKSRHLKGLLLSSARSWLFNQVVSERVKQDCWQTLFAQEPVNLHATNSFFQSDGSDNETDRLSQFDIHPTAPMWGGRIDSMMSNCQDLLEWEQTVMSPYLCLQEGLEAAKVDYQRRSVRSVAKGFTWSIEGQSLTVSFELIRGQFATSVLRELVDV